MVYMNVCVFKEENMETVIRDARKEDCAELATLIKELAEYEKMSDKVNITEEVLERDGFGKDPFFRCVVGEVNKTNGNTQLVGYGLYFFTYSTFNGRSIYLEDLYVTPEYRGQGVGTKIWSKVAKIALENQCVRLDFIVLNWNNSAIEYYEKKGCIDLTVREKWHLYRLPYDAMKKLAD